MLPDYIALGGYALLAAGLLGFSRSSGRGPFYTWSVVLDGLIAALALAASAWVFAVQPVLQADHAPMAVKLILTAYPAMSIFLVVATWRIAFDPGRERVPAFWFLLLAMTCMFCGDVVYRLADMNLLHVPLRILDLPYVFAFLCAGATALHPSMRQLTELGRGQRSGDTRIRTALVAVALLIPAVLRVQSGHATPADRDAFSVLILILSGVTILRVVQALRLAERSEAKLIFQANHDHLTGLPNRRLMEQHLSQRLEERVDRAGVALLYLDLDRFKLVNDTHGHSRGDELLVLVAERLRSHVRPSDMVARIGGDEFMIILDHALGVLQAVELANRLHVCLKEPFEVPGWCTYVSASIGVAFASGGDPDATTEALVRDADTAMYQAKDAGRNGVAIFDASMHARVAERVELEHDLRDAVARNQLFVVYQPIMDLAHATPVGMEALLRWQHPTHGVISPAKFIPLAEETGLITEIGGWVLEKAVGQLAAWCRRSPRMKGLYVSVNLSGVQLRHADIVRRVADALAVHDLEASSLCLELTESVVMEDPTAAAAILAELRQLGVKIAIDDFGSEYSSLAYLKHFPVSVLKIDKSFIDNVAEPDNADATLVTSVIAMAQAFAIDTIAEGVETPAQAARLLELGCSAAQGYYYSRPVSADGLPEVIGTLGTRRIRLVSA
jgi:diguanylate cyclase (GGDEF)-like protein